MQQFFSYLKYLVFSFYFGFSILAAVPLPQRIASGTVGADEIVVDLLSRSQQLSRLVAVSIFADNPQYSQLRTIPGTIKGRVGDSIEALLALKPDLAILASYNRIEIARQLRAAGVQVIVQENFRNIADIQNNIRAIAKSIGQELEAEKLLIEMDQSLTHSKAPLACKTEKPRLLQYSEQDTVPGLNTLFNDAAERAGFINLAASLKLEGWASLSQEILVTLRPDFIVVAGDPNKRIEMEKKMRSRVGWQKLKAVQQGRLIIVPESQLYSVSQHITKLVKALAAARGC